MQKKWALMLLLFGLFVILGDVQARAQGIPELQFEPEILLLEAGQETSQADGQVQVTASGDTFSNLQISSMSLLDVGGVEAVPATSLVVNPAAIAELTPDNSITLRVTVSPLPEAGTYTGFLDFSYDGKPEEAEIRLPVTLKVSEAAPPIIEEDPSGEDSANQADNSPPEPEVISAADETSESVFDPAVSTRPSGQANSASNPIKIVMRGDGTETSIPLWVRQIGEDEFTGVKLQGFLLDQEGEQVTETQITFTVAGTDIQSEGMTVPAGGVQVLVLMNISTLSRFGEFSGFVVAEQQGKSQEVAHFALSRYPDPVVNFAEAKASDTISFQVPTTNFAQTLSILSDSLAGVKDLEVFVSDLQGEKGGNSIPVLWDLNGNQGPQDITGRASLPLNLSASLPVTDHYSGFIRLTYEGGVKTVNLSLARALATQTISVTGLTTVQILTDSCSFCPVTSRDARRFGFSIEETSGAEITLNSIEIANLSLPGETSKTDARFDGITLLDQDGEPASGNITISGRELRRILVDPQNLKEPGSYDAVLKITAPDMATVEQTFKILVARPEWVAALWILISLIFSYFIRYWVEHGRPKIIVQERAEKLLKKIGSMKNEIGEDVAKGDKAKILQMLTNIETRLTKIKDGEQSDNAAANQSLETWNQKIRHVRPLIDGFRKVFELKPEKIQEAPRAHLEGVMKKFLDDTATGDQIKTELDQLEEIIRNATRDALAEKAQDLLGRIENKPKDEKGNLQEKFANIKNALDQGLNELGAKPYSEETLNKAAGYINPQMTAFIKIVISELLQILAAQQTPRGFTDDEWTTAKIGWNAQLSSALEAAQKGNEETALQTYQAAHTSYLSLVLEKLGRYIQQRIDSYAPDIAEAKEISTKPSTSEKALAEASKIITFGDGLNAIRTEIQAAQNLIGEGKLDQAATRYGKILADLKALKTPDDKFLGGAETAPAESLALSWDTASDLLSILFPTGALAESDLAERWANLSYFTRQRITGDLLVNGAIYFLAVVGGLNLLYGPTWGGWEDIVAVLVWGFGLQQGLSAGLGGLQNLLTQKPTT